MFLVNFLLLVVAATNSLLLATAATDRVVCYWGTFAVYRPSNGKFEPEDIDPTLCTHIIYAFVGLGPQHEVKLLDSYFDIDLRGFERFYALKKINPQVKILLSIGGWNEGSFKYSQMAAESENRATLINSTVQLLDKYHLDGLDFSWKYPNQRGGKPEDKENFVILLKEFQEEFKKHGYILSAAVAPTASSVDRSYNVPKVCKYVDFINVMAYDLHGHWQKVTGINAPLAAHPTDVMPAQKELNVQACIDAWIKRGAPPKKINLGIATFGHCFTLKDPSDPSIGVAVSAAGTPGPYTRIAGTLGYNEICEYHKQHGWIIKWSDEQETAYMHKGNQWCGYDDEKSVAHKVAFAKKMQLGGIMMWSLETDDFRGSCGPKYPILKVIKKNL